MRAGPVSVYSCHWAGGTEWTDHTSEDIVSLQMIPLRDVYVCRQKIFNDGSLQFFSAFDVQHILFIAVFKDAHFFMETVSVTELMNVGPGIRFDNCRRVGDDD